MTIISSKETSVRTYLKCQKNCRCKDEKMYNMKPFKHTQMQFTKGREIEIQIKWKKESERSKVRDALSLDVNEHSFLLKSFLSTWWCKSINMWSLCWTDLRVVAEIFLGFGFLNYTSLLLWSLIILRMVSFLSLKRLSI